MKHELIVKVEPLGPPKRKTEKPADLDDVWYPVPGKPDFEVNGRGQMRTKVDPPPAAPAPVYSFVPGIRPADGQWKPAAGKVWLVNGELPIESPYWGRPIPAMLGDVVADAAVTVAPPTTGSGLQLLLNAGRVRQVALRKRYNPLSVDALIRVFKEFSLDDPVIKVV